jgi:uncharacterized protein with ATP-grasp and redox domains
VKIDVECVPCFVRQALATVRRATDDESLQWRVMREVACLVDGLSPDTTPPEFAERVYGIIGAVTGNDDPYLHDKKRANSLVLELEPGFKDVLRTADDSVLTAVKLAISGNSMDLGVVGDYGDVAALAKTMLAEELVVDDYASFARCLEKASHVLFVGDNAGEIVFDRMLIEEMGKMRECKFSYVVRGRPAINDVTAEDALAAGIDRVATIVDTGAGAPGLVLAECSDAVRRLFLSADMVVAKGQGNYEALSDAPRDVFFLLLVKCPVVSREFAVPVGAAVVKHHRVG